MIGCNENIAPIWWNINIALNQMTQFLLLQPMMFLNNRQENLSVKEETSYPYQLASFEV